MLKMTKTRTHTNTYYIWNFVIVHLSILITINVQICTYMSYALRLYTFQNPEDETGNSFGLFHLHLLFPGNQLQLLLGMGEKSSNHWPTGAGAGHFILVDSSKKFGLLGPIPLPLSSCDCEPKPIFSDIGKYWLRATT